MKKIAILASGSGTNAENIIQYFKNKPEVEVSLVMSNNPKAYVLQRAQKHGVPTTVFTRDDFYNSCKVIDDLKDANIDLVVLAGFLWLVPQSVIASFPGAVINIHPALLPSYGGKGMYGERVHQAVKAAGDSQTGITIHFVNELYDEGHVIAQYRCDIASGDTPARIAEKVHELEYRYYPEVIERLVKS